MTLPLGYNIVNKISEEFNLNNCDIQFCEITKKYITVSPIDFYVVAGYSLEFEPATFLPFIYRKKSLILQERYMEGPCKWQH